MNPERASNLNRIKMLIADSSAIYRKLFAQAAAEVMVNADLDYASNQEEALDKIRRSDYNMVVFDAEIAASGVVDFLSEIAWEIPKATVLVAARPSITNYYVFAKAEAHGAAWMLKPVYKGYGENLDAAKNTMANMVRIAREYRENKRKRPEIKPAKTNAVPKAGDFRPEIALIASSTGGPPALHAVLSALDSSFPLPILIVQHTLPRFTEMLAQDLDKKTELSVRVAKKGESPAAGIVYIAPGGLHMKLNAEKRIFFDESPPMNGVRPAADVLFESVADVSSWSGVLAVILTGMGRDGEKGLARLKEKQNCFCLAQSEKTCVVYGMPRAAVESGLVDRVLDLDKIAKDMGQLARGSGRASGSGNRLPGWGRAALR